MSMQVTCDQCGKTTSAVLIPKEVSKTPVACFYTQPADWRWVFNDVHTRNACSDICAEGLRLELDKELIVPAAPRPVTT